MFSGRDDQHADVILLASFTDAFRQSTMVFTEQTGLEKLYGMLSYAFDVTRCRRDVIAQHFGERWQQQRPQEHQPTQQGSGLTHNQNRLAPDTIG